MAGILRQTRRWVMRGVLGGGVVAGMASPGLAEEWPIELKLGVMAHDIGILGHQKEDGVDGNAEVLWLSPKWLSWLGSPRPHVGTHINTHGDTSQIYGGLTWTYEPAALDPVWGAFAFGGAVHNGETGTTTNPDEKELGSRVLFRLGLELGYNVTERTSVSVLYDHVSNANLADQNEGLNNLGLRVGIRF